jgi:hypothetical protein
MALDVPESERRIFTHFSSLVTSMVDGNNQDTTLDLHDTNVLTDQMMIKIAMEAFNDMRDYLRAHDPTKPGEDRDEYLRDWPSALAVLEVDGSLFLSSSIKNNGGGFVLRFPNTPVARDLKQCTVAVVGAENGPQHHYGGNCAEPSAAALFYRAHPDWVHRGEHPNHLPDGARIVTVGTNSDDVLGALAVKPACNPTYYPVWGCRTFLPSIGVRDIGETQTTEAPYPDGWRPVTAGTCLE